MPSERGMEALVKPDLDEVERAAFATSAGAIPLDRERLKTLPGSWDGLTLSL